MKKLTTLSLDQMKSELTLLDESAQRRYIGGGGTCGHSVDLSCICPLCAGETVVSWNEYLRLEEADEWNGGWYLGMDGIPRYAMPAAGAGLGEDVITGYCKEHGGYEGQKCLWNHVGFGNEYCPDHRIWYNGSECLSCWAEEETITGYCPDHDMSWEIREGVTGCCAVCGDTGNSGGGGSSGGSSGPGPSVGPPSENDNPYCSIDYVISHCLDLTFNEEKRTQLQDSLTNMRKDPLGDYLYDKMVLSGDFVLFTIGETQYRPDPVTGEKRQASAQYSKGVITFNPTAEINETLLGEEFIHAIQHDVYGSEMTAKNLNYEFEAKIINHIINGGPSLFPPDTPEIKRFNDFITEITDGKSDELTLTSKFQELVGQWNAPGYTDQEGYTKPEGFDPRLLKEVAGV